MEESRKKQEENERKKRMRIKQRIGEVVRKKYRRHRLEVAKENGRKNIAGQITLTKRTKHWHHKKL